MVHPGFLKQITQPMTGLALSALILQIYALPGMAQTPTKSGTSNASPSATPPASNLNRLNQENYILGPGDQVQLSMFDQPDLFNSAYPVLVDGTLSLPLLGSVSVDGLTLRQASNVISAKYTRYFKRPIISVALSSPRGINVGITGEVSRPGSYPVSSDKAQLPTLTEALTLAGGTTQAADLRQIQLRRPRKSAPDDVVIVDLWRLLQTGDLSQDITLRDGDSVYVPTATTFNPAESAQIADASFAAAKVEPLNVAVVGEVYRPGPYTLNSGYSVVGEAGSAGSGGSGGGSRTLPTVTQAIQVAGGIKPEANIRKIQIRRVLRTGSEQTLEVDLWRLLQEGDLRQDIALQKGDTVIIPTATALTAAEATKLATANFSPSSINVNFVGEVKNAGITKLPPNTPLNAAILAAGGFNQGRAKKSSVDLIRLNPDGTISKREVKIDLATGINEKTNPPLRNNDVIVVGRSSLTKFGDTLSTIMTPVSRGFSFLRLFGF